MTHAVTVSVSGHLERHWMWGWRCTCGVHGVLLSTEEAARAEASAHTTTAGGAS